MMLLGRTTSNGCLNSRKIVEIDRRKRSVKRFQTGEKIVESESTTAVYIRCCDILPTAMRARQLIAITMAALLLIGAGAALGAASPADGANDTGTDAYDENTPDDQDGVADATDEDGVAEATDHDGADATTDRADTAASIGPSDGLPDQVPDHVNEIHDRIESFLNGAIDSLGESLSDLLGDGEADSENAESANDSDDEA